jgi:hypothetical protein
MTNVFQRQPLIAGLAVAAALLVAVIGVETGFGSRIGARIPAGVSKRAAPFEARLLAPFAPVDADRAYPEMAARPLFIATRRPAPPAEAPSQATFKRDQYVLQGVTIAGDTRIALLREKATGRIHRVEKGKELNGVTVAEVTPGSVTLALGKDQEVLPLQVLKPGAAPAVAPQGPFGPSAGPGAIPAPAGAANPLAPPTPANPHPPGASNPSTPAAAANPPAATLPQATTAPMSPEELLARRRARRAQQNQ